MRCIPPVHSPVSLSDLFLGAMAAAGVADVARMRLELEQQFLVTYDARGVFLCDSGTSALVAAFRAVAGGKAMRVACPAYVCVDVGAAAVAGGVELALYDSDPATLSPDMNSLERVVAGGCGAILVAHLYGFSVAIDDVLALCHKHGVALIEDAAQEAGATFRGRRLGSFGDLRIHSFGRGKGITGGGGGALTIARDCTLEPLAVAQGGSHSGWRGWAVTVAQWALGRPSLYALPLSIPGLRLGEMVYKQAHEPLSISRSSLAMVSGSLAAQPAAMAARRANAALLHQMTERAHHIRPIAPVSGAEPSWLRFPLVDAGASLQPSRRIGATRGYPRLLDEEERLGGIAQRGAERLSGALELRDKLLTLPTHHMLRDGDHVAITRWIDSGTRRSGAQRRR